MAGSSAAAGHRRLGCDYAHDRRQLRTDQRRPDRQAADWWRSGQAQGRRIDGTPRASVAPASQLPRRHPPRICGASDLAGGRAGGLSLRSGTAGRQGHSRGALRLLRAGLGGGRQRHRRCLGTGRGDCRAPPAYSLCRPPGRTHSLLQPDRVDRLPRSSWRD